MPMTPKKQAFVDAILSGKNQSDAYGLAYENGNMLPATVRNNAYKLMWEITGLYREPE